MKNPRLYISAVIAAIIIAAVCAGCTSIGTVKVNTSADEIGSVMGSIDVPEVVLEAAKTEVGRLYEKHCEDFPDYGYVNWRIEHLNYSYTYENLGGMLVVIYQMNYEFLSESPENIVLAGGMYITKDNWVMPDYPNSTYLIFRLDGDNLIFMRSIMENDCEPGTQTFTDDLCRVLSLSQTDISEYSVFVDGKWLALGTYYGSFPWGYSLTEISRERRDGDGFHNVNHVICDNLGITYMQADEEGKWTVTFISTTSPEIKTHRGIGCGMSETELRNTYGEDLVFSETYADNGTPTAEYDYVYGYAPAGDNTCNHIVFLIKNSVIAGMEIQNLIDGRLFQ